MTADPRPLSDEYLNAFVDGELAEADAARAIERIGAEQDLKQRVCELRLLKDMVKAGYRQVPDAGGAAEAGRRRRHSAQALAACCLVVAGLAAGWLGRGLYAAPVEPLRVASLAGVAAQPGKIMLHVDGAAPARFQRLLDSTEAVLDQAGKDGRRVQVELVANSQGLDLFRVATSPYARRIQALQARYPDLVLVGCGQTLKKLQERGQDTRLLPGVRVAPAALDEIVGKLQTGWVYLKV